MIRLTRADPKWLIGRGDPNFDYFRTSGRVHAVEDVIVRWRGLGGTIERPNISVSSVCGRQESLGDVSAYSRSTRIESVLGAFGLCRSCEKKLQRRLDNQRASSV